MSGDTLQLYLVSLSQGQTVEPTMLDTVGFRNYTQSNGRRAYVANYSSRDVPVINAANNAITTTITIPGER